jgi:hypothetical protein
VSLRTTVVSVTVTPDGGGYWLLTAAGGVYNFGDAQWYGSPRRLAAGMVPEGLVAKPDGGGYWVYGQTGVVAAFGDAASLGPAGRPIVDLVATPDSAGYRVVDSKGMVSAYGTAAFYGDERASRLPHPVVGMAASPDGAGYWLVTHDGDIHPFGDATSSKPSVTAFVHTVVTAGDVATEWPWRNSASPTGGAASGPPCSTAPI